MPRTEGICVMCDRYCSNARLRRAIVTAVKFPAIFLEGNETEESCLAHWRRYRVLLSSLSSDLSSFAGAERRRALCRWEKSEYRRLMDAFLSSRQPFVTTSTVYSTYLEPDLCTTFAATTSKVSESPRCCCRRCWSRLHRNEACRALVSRVESSARSPVRDAHLHVCRQKILQCPGQCWHLKLISC